MTWQENFILSGQTVATATIESIQLYMSNKAAFADAAVAKRKDGGETEKWAKRLQGGGDKSRNNKKNKSGLVKPDNKYPIHGGHQWKDCFDNIIIR